MIKRIIIGLLSGLLLLCGCSKPDDVIELPDQPGGYQDLLSAYNSGYTYLKSEVTSELLVTTIYFKEKTLTLPTGGIMIHDHRKSDIPPIGLNSDTKMWTMYSQSLGIRDHSTLSNEQATSVYAWIDKETLHILVSNGNQLDFNFVQKEPLPDARKFTMPSVYIYTDGKAPIESKEVYVTGKVVIKDPDCTYGEEKEVTLTGKFKGRGNSTWGMPKKPYRIKLDSKATVLGMPSSKNWALLANYADKSLIRNRTAMLVSSMVGMSWTPKLTPVELYLNDKYLGLYDLCEHKETGKNKVNINVVGSNVENGEDLEGDYYLELDENMDETVCFYTKKKRMPIMFSDPETPNQAQQDYVKKCFNDFEQALFSTDFKDPNKGYAAYIDVESFVNFYIVQELAKNVDGNTRRSSFITKEKGKKLKMYHVWDFDLSFGNADYFPSAIGNGPKGLWVRYYGPYDKNSGWYYRLFEDDAFKKKVKERWDEVYPQLERVPEYIDIMVEELGDAPTKNFSKWTILNQYVWPNVKVTGSYSKEIEYLKSFYTERLEYLNGEIQKY